jgi:hypothetical protein
VHDAAVPGDDRRLRQHLERCSRRLETNSTVCSPTGSGLSHKRVNLVNPRREFFYATPVEVKDLLIALGDDHVFEYIDTAEAVEW